ncbi:hypothetical protein [Piscinibacter sakaiensis]|uniref:hypothetical protein n=1 Tax=Piscinibacter sakaiensis TaxID=1547922 RepID=UPI003AAAF904
MSSPMHSLRRPEAPLTSLRRALHTLASSLANGAGALQRELAAMAHSVVGARQELRRMADQYEATDPDQAARLRKLAASNWDE